MITEKRMIDINRVIDALILQFPQINVPFVEMALETIPTVDAMEVVHGKWVSVPHKLARVCSVCNRDEPYKFADIDADVYDYCPHCGAKMDGDRNG